MIFYHGAQHALKIDKGKKSRYGFPVMFFTDNRKLSEAFSKEGYLYKADIKVCREIDYKGNVSHSRDFRNKIYAYYKSNCKSVLIKNTYDRPDASCPLVFCSIVVVFDLDLINNLELCT